MRRSRPWSNERSTAESCSAGRTPASIPTWFVGAMALLFSALREIFDESAYSRFLARHEMRSCPDAYAVFLREQENLKARSAKCC
jgi:hypothetical protein